MEAGLERGAAVCWPRYALDTNVYSALLSHVRSASCARSCSRQIKASKVSRVDVNALSRSCGWQQRDWTDSDWQSSWLGAEVLTKGLGLRCRPRLESEPSLRDCFGGMAVRDSMRCFSVLLMLRWQWGEQEWMESFLSDTGVVYSKNLLNRTALPTTSSVLCPPRAPEREQTQSQHEQLLVCTVRSLVETNIMQLCRLCRLMCCHCEMRPPRVHSSGMSSVPSATSHFTSDASHPGQIDTWCSDHFSCSMYGWVPLFLSVEPSFLRLVTCHMHVTAGVQPASRPIRGWTPLWRRHTGSRAARPCGGILYVRKLSLQTTQVFDGTIFSYCRLRDYDAQVRKPVGLSAALILLSSFAVRSVLRRPLLLR